MLHEARVRLPDARLVVGDALAPPLAHETFDVACSFGAFGHIAVGDQPRFVAAVRALLVPGGRFVFVTADAPPILSTRRLAAHAFNAAMRLRNAVKSPPFVMYYLTFLLPRARALLVDAGFDVVVHRDVVPPYVVVDAYSGSRAG
jgi:SAM-dependent methyltransferase